MVRGEAWARNEDKNDGKSCLRGGWEISVYNFEREMSGFND